MTGLRLPATLVCLLILTLVPTAAATAADDPYAALLAPAGTCGAAADQLDLDATTAAAAMQCLTNYARAQESLPALQLNPGPDAAGLAKLKSDLSCG